MHMQCLHGGKGCGPSILLHRQVRVVVAGTSNIFPPIFTTSRLAPSPSTLIKAPSFLYMQRNPHLWYTESYRVFESLTDENCAIKISSLRGLTFGSKYATIEQNMYSDQLHSSERTNMKHFAAHMIGDYFLQSDWMANNKTKSNVAAASHAFAYSIPFLFFKPTIKQYALITSTHFLIDRFRLARYIVWSKNFLAPKGQDHTMTDTGMPETCPTWLAFPLLIVTDNTLHCLINSFVLRKKGSK